MTISQTICIATSMFIAHLVNQSVAHELVAFEMLIHLLETPSDDGVEIAVGFLREVGQYLDQNAPKSTETIYKRLRAVLQEESAVSKRVQYMIEVIFQVRKDKFKDNPPFPEGLDLVQEEDQITHEVALDDDLQVQDSLSKSTKISAALNPLTRSLLDIFKFDPNFLENEAKYKEIKNEILGSDDEEDDGDGSAEESEEEGGGRLLQLSHNRKAHSYTACLEVDGIEGIQDHTGTNLVNLRRVIYLTIMNSLTYEEAVHKLMKINIEEGQEVCSSFRAIYYIYC